MKTQDLHRRDMLRQGAALAGLLAAAGFPQFARAAFNKTAFDARTVAEAVSAVGGARLAESKDVRVSGPDITENGAAVSLGVATSLSGVKQLLLLVEKNPAPLAAIFHMTEHIEPNFSIRAKMGQTSDVYAVAIMNDGSALWAKREVKVTVGGCGA